MVNSQSKFRLRSEAEFK